MVEGGDLAFADGFDFGGDRFDEREVKEMGHDFSFVFPGLSLRKSNGFSNHSFELTGQTHSYSLGISYLRSFLETASLAKHSQK